MDSARQLYTNSLQVPEDLQSILNDNSLFNGSADITTKEILKRYGDIGKQTPQRTVQSGDITPTRSKEGSSRSNAPVATRVDTDPYQATAWQKQSSVRHVQAGPGGPPAPAFGGEPGSTSTPPPNNFEFSAPNSPYRERQGSQGSLGPPTGRQSYQPKPGPMGVAG